MNASLTTDHFERLYQQNQDPWQVGQRWYEQRKQALLLACLPRLRYQRAFEPACGTGILSVALAERCHEVLAADGSATAVAIARKNTHGLAQVRIDQRHLPGDWPSGMFDLIVLSEWLYYLSSENLAETVRCCKNSLAENGTLIACHWRPGFVDRVQSTDLIHAAFKLWPRLVRHEEHDFLLEAWSPSARSVAQEEGLS